VLPNHQTLSTYWLSVPANGFGVALLLLVVSDAQLRAQSERALSLVSQAQLNAWRARIHPHFLFNSLNSIAELCELAPQRAEAAIVQLSRIMRYSLESNSRITIPLAEEIDVARAYVGIEQERLGDRLAVNWQCDSASDPISVPPFAVQTLVENAVNHGLVPKKGAITLTVIVRISRSRTLVAVQDNGVGIPQPARILLSVAETPESHSMQILNQHLVQLYGRRARLRVFSKESVGTLISFAVPRRGRRSK
jgi:two-component system sensor histidine kinase LytS